MEWEKAIAYIEPFVVKIQTPEGWGTGFVMSHSTLAPICGIATALHVVDYSKKWELPISITHVASGKSILVKNEERAIFSDDKKDTAVIVIDKGELPLPAAQPSIGPERMVVYAGTEVGWLGYPAISSKSLLCFFSGRVSCRIPEENSYLIDGVAINGVSGGPTFVIPGETKFPLPVIIGIVTAYMPNYATGATLPGVSVVRDVSQLNAVLKALKTVEDARIESKKSLSHK